MSNWFIKGSLSGFNDRKRKAHMTDTNNCCVYFNLRKHSGTRIQKSLSFTGVGENTSGVSFIPREGKTFKGL